MTKGTTRRFQPTFWPTVFSIPVFLVALGLGTWQLQRMEWKKEQIALRQERSGAEAVSFDELYAGNSGVPAEEEFRHVWIEGEFLHDEELILGARSLDRRLGVQIVTPFALRDGREILVNRGFAPSELKESAARPEGQVKGTVRIEGLLRVPGWKGYEMVKPANDPIKNFWFYVDIPEMARHTGLSNPVQDIYLDAGPAANPGGYPLGGQTRIELVNNHLEYVITWYAMALILAVIYFVFHYRPVEKLEDET
ncbi:SURF1 family protein [Kiloniella laminariae]|uniref:SURF1-like protein n=1 Tax=Kiloniella laminariae TaxID=454162 RepID=A0ABT4LKZ6_9PROT|nr:SURF1 family protein [Kiloniella laminariae]MCZ4281784.1 SURF1 family protein [Kiloniella laminariae]